MSTTVGPFRFMLILLLTVGLTAAAMAQDRLEVVEAEGRLEWARVVPDLGRLETENRITVRALRGFGRLPESYARLALDLRKQGVDLLAAGSAEIQELIARAESGELATNPEPLRELLTFLDNRDYYEWTPVSAGDVIEAGESDLLRGQGRLVLRDESGQVRTVEQTGEVEVLTSLIQSLPTDPSPSLSTETLTAEQRDAEAQAADNASQAAEDPAAQTAGNELQAPDDADVQAADNGPDPDTVVPDLPRLWSDAPGMRLFGQDIPVQQLGMEWFELAALCSGPDNGHLVAGSVQTPFGLQTWAVRYDAQGMPVWSRTLGGEFDTYVTGAASLGSDGFLLGGSLDGERPGFFIALDADGNVRWSRVANKGQGETGKDWIYALASDGQSAVAVGQVMDQQDNSQALAMSVPADGSAGWRAVIDDGLVALHALALNDGWIIGGKGPQAGAEAWVARLTAQGQVAWSRTYDSGGGVDALARTASGEILSAGSNAQSGMIWLRTLGDDGEVRRELDLDLVLDGVQVPRSVLSMALDADGDIWLAGETVSDDGWLARVAPDGQVRWVRVYGREDADALKAVQATANGAMAVGQSFSPDGMGVCSLWLVAVDASGQPLTAPAVSEDAQAFAATLHAVSDVPGLNQGAVHFAQDQDGAVRMVLPFISASQGLPGFGGHYTELGQLACLGQPVKNTPGRWEMRIDLPERMTVRSDTGSEMGAVVTEKRVASFVLDTTLRTPLNVDLLLEGVRFDPAGPRSLDGLHQELGLADDAGAMGTSSLDRLAAELAFEQDASGRWGGPLMFEVSQWRQQDAAGKALGQLESMRVKADYADLDLAVLGAMPARLEAVLTSATEPEPGVLGQLVDDYIRSIGTGRGEFVMSNFSINDPDSDERFTFRELKATGEVSATGPQSLLRDMMGGYGVQGLDVFIDGTTVNVEQASVDMRLDRFAMAHIMRTVFDGLASGNPAAGWPDLVTKALGGLDVKFGLRGVNATGPGQEPVTIDHGSLRFSATDLDTPHVGVALAYEHAGVGGLPTVPAEVMPRAIRFDTSLTRIPLMPLLTALPVLAADPTAAFKILAEHNSTLNISTVDVDLPLGGLHLSGQGQAEAAGAVPLGRIDADIEIRNFQALTNWLGTTMDEGQRQAMQAMATVVQLAGVEEKGGDGNVLHRYKVEFDSQGKLNVNGKDLSALLGTGQAAPGHGEAGASGQDAPANQDQEQPGTGPDASVPAPAQ